MGIIMITKELLFLYLLAQSKSEFRIIIVTVTQRIKITSFLIADSPMPQGAWRGVLINNIW